MVKPSTYTRKDFSKVLLGYLSENGVAADVKWNYITHLAVQLGQVSADGSLDITKGNANQLMDELVARGHNRGIPVILSIYGRLAPVDGWALYGSDDMGLALRDPSKRASLVARLKDYVTRTKLDGIDIVMTDFNGATNYSANLAAIRPTVDELKAALPANSIVTVTVTPGWQHWEYPDLSTADWVNVRAFEDGVHVEHGAPVGQASSSDYLKSTSDIWKNFHLAPDKIVVEFPVFGLRYNALDGNGNNLSWGLMIIFPTKTFLPLTQPPIPMITSTLQMVFIIMAYHQLSEKRIILRRVLSKECMAGTSMQMLRTLQNHFSR